MAAKYAEDSFYSFSDDDRTASCPDGLHEENRYLPGFVRKIRRTDSDSDISRFERSFELAQNNQGKDFTWKHYLKILQQMWFQHLPDVSKYIKVSALKSCRNNTKHHFISTKRYVPTFQDSRTERNSIFEPSCKKDHKRNLELKNYQQKTYKNRMMVKDATQNHFGRHAVNEDTPQKLPCKNILYTDSFRKTSQQSRVPENLCYKPPKRSSVIEDYNKKKIEKYTVPEDTRKKIYQRIVMSEDFLKKSPPKSRVSKDFLKHVSYASPFDDSFKKTHLKNKGFRKNIAHDADSISSVDTNSFVTPMAKMWPDISRYVTPLSSFKNKSVLCSTSKDSFKKASLRNTWKRRLPFKKGIDIDSESISSIDSNIFVTPLTQMGLLSEIPSYDSNSEAELYHRKPILHELFSLTNDNTIPKTLFEEMPKKHTWSGSFIKKKVDFDTDSISSIDSNFLPLTPLVKKLHSKISSIKSESCTPMGDIFAKSKKKVKDRKHCLQTSNEPIYAKVQKKRLQCRGKQSNGDIKAQSLTSSTSGHISEDRDGFVNELQFKVKQSLWRRMKAFVKKEFKINKKSFARKFTSKKNCEIEL